jgi:NAD(P)-dependent dehydrogenase (short-subunit alcohol dehydrogenase family)
MSDAPMKGERNVLELFSLRGRMAVVTGAAGHLGAPISRALAEAGALVVATSRDRARAEMFAASLPMPSGAEHFGAACDHFDADAVECCIETIVKRTARIDILINNAHEVIANDWTDVTREQFDRQLANATGYFLLARALRNHAVFARRPASIVMLGSMYGLVGSYPKAYEGISSASPAAYHALKGAIIQLTRHLAVYWAKDNIRVNCLSPGPFPDECAPDELKDRLRAKSPIGRLGEPSELKGAVLLLASDAGSYITGQNFVVDGGWTAW